MSDFTAAPSRSAGRDPASLGTLDLGRAAFSLVFLSLGGCAAQIPETEHRSALAAQQAEYEGRLRRQSEAASQVEGTWRRALEGTERRHGECATRIEALEDALADKQRRLEEARKVPPSARPAVDAAARRGPIEAVAGRLREALRAQLEAGRAELATEGEFLRLRLGDGVLFEANSTRLGAEAAAILAAVSGALRSQGEVRVQVVAHTDAVRPEAAGSVGERVDTWEITARQALAALRQLQVTGLDPSRLSLRAAGHFHPLATHDTEEGRAKNRRVELELWVARPGAARP